MLCRLFEPAWITWGGVNAEIEATMTEIDAYVQKLTQTREGLSATHSKNQQIVRNFKSLLCEE